MRRAIVVAFHKYTPFGGEFYEPILDFQIQTLKKYEDEYDHVYFIDSTWNIDPQKIKDLKASAIKVNPSLRYYDAYKEVLPQIKEDLVLLMDNDTLIYKPGIIARVFSELDNYDAEGIEVGASDVVSIIDQIGTYKTDKLKNGNKFCPYFFGTRKELLLKYLDVEWGPSMPKHETLGKLTEKMLEDGARVYEWEEDKSDILFPGISGSSKGKNLGYYHIRAGSTPAVLLAWKNNPDHEKTYWEYLKNQPKSEYLRQLAWYLYMLESNENYYDKYYTFYLRDDGNDINDLFKDSNINTDNWKDYYDKFKEFHGL